MLPDNVACAYKCGDIGHIPCAPVYLTTLTCTITFIPDSSVQSFYITARNSRERYATTVLTITMLCMSASFICYSAPYSGSGNVIWPCIYTSPTPRRRENLHPSHISTKGWSHHMWTIGRFNAKHTGHSPQKLFSVRYNYT